MGETKYAPLEGDFISIQDVNMILEAVKKRQENFPDEPLSQTMGLILVGIGDRFAPVTCINGEYTGLKQDLPPGEGIPKCPNGHVLTQGPGLRLGWFRDE